LQEIENLSFLSPWSINSFKTELDNKVSHIWALEDEKKLIGYICFWMFANEVQILNFAVHPDRRNKKAGLSLLNRLIEYCRPNGVTNIWLEVRPSNTAARRLYRKTGFKEIGKRPQYYPDTKEDAILMALEITIE
jgi:ribosomal-protein-alanine N-acetyltransferase